MRKTILIIEDNFDIREGTAEILSLAGNYEVLTAENGKEGVDIALNQRPDLILCDIMMPELDGYGVLYILAKNPVTADIPFVFLTAKSERADLRKAMEMGADDYLTKPFDDLELLNAIETRLKKRERVVNNAPSVTLSGLGENEPDQLLHDLVQNTRRKLFKRKHLIYEEGDTPHFIYYIVKGMVRSFLLYQDGRELSTDIYIDDSFFGFESVMLNRKYTDNAAALEDCEIALIPKEKFFELFYNKRSIADKFIKMLSGNIHEKEEQMLAFAYDTVRKRVANALVIVAEKSLDDDTQDTVTIRISRDDLAALAGTANETISRMLADFKDEELITKKGSAISIASIKKLKAIKF